jgi:hypothetical protein
MTNKQKLKIAIQALKDIHDPISRLKRNMEEGYVLDGFYAVQLSQNASFLKDIAKDALVEIKEIN